MLDAESRNFNFSGSELDQLARIIEFVLSDDFFKMDERNQIVVDKEK
jgi:hypothetical protein